MTIGEKIKKLCDVQDQLQQEYLRGYYGMNTSSPTVYCRYKGASSKELLAGEKYWNQKYPPSYRAFLAQQNGGLRFASGWTLVGAPRSENKKQYAEIDKAFAQIPVVANAEERTALAERQKRDPKVILPTQHMAIGTDFNYGLLIFDRYRISRSGEPEIAWVRYGIHVEARWKNFEEFVKDMIARTKKSLAKLQKPGKARETERASPVKKAKAPVRDKSKSRRAAGE